MSDFIGMMNAISLFSIDDGSWDTTLPFRPQMQLDRDAASNTLELSVNGSIPGESCSSLEWSPPMRLGVNLLKNHLNCRAKLLITLTCATFDQEETLYDSDGHNNVYTASRPKLGAWLVVCVMSQSFDSSHQHNDK